MAAGPDPARVPRRRARTGPLAAAAASLLASAWLAGFVAFCFSLPERPAPEAWRTDATAVLTGMEDRRLARGFALFDAGAAPWLLVSGVPAGYGQADMRRWAGLGAAPPSPRIEMGHAARDTRGNAREIAAWAARHGFRSLRIVTADYHMPRALWLLRRAMPGATLLPDPVAGIPDDPRDRWRNRRVALARRISDYDKLLVQYALARAGLLPA